MLALPRIVLFIAICALWAASPALAAQIDIEADEITRSADGVVIATGNVVIKRTTDTLRADKVVYRTEQKVLEARGHVVIESPQATIHAEQAVMNTDSQTGNIQKAVITLPGGERLQAERLKRIDDQRFEAEGVIYSACPVDEESWRIRASSALLDQQEASLTMTDGRFELWEIPILYTPWWQQPLKRKSGLLMPQVNSGNRRGTELAIPLYFAPAENWDTTITPRWMSARGIMGEAELRHISALGTERFYAAGINDSLTQKTRGRLQSDILWQLPANLNFAVKADHVSDQDYLADYTSGSDISTRYLQSVATLSQAALYGDLEVGWSLSAQHQQDLLLASNASTLQILPRLESRASWFAHPNVIFNIEQQTTRFDRTTGVAGWRMDLHPYVEVPWELAGGGISAKLQAGTHHTRYWLKQTNLAETAPVRTTAEFSLEVRSDFESINKQGSWRHAISPILRYDFIEAPDQSALPNFDSAFGLLAWNNLLSGNRFSGYDRIEKTNRVSLMLENRFQHKSGVDALARDLLIVRAGVSYDLQRQTVDAALKPAATRPFSNLLGAIIFQPATGIYLSSSGQYDPGNKYWATISSALRLNDSSGNNLSIGYQLTDARYTTESQLMNISTNLNLPGRWRANGNWQYDYLLKFTQQTTLGLKYQHPCWTAGTEVYRINRRTGTAKASNLGFRILLEFKGLGSVGS